MYMYQLEEVRQAYHELRTALPKFSDIYYSLKANPHPDIVKELVNLGCYVEVSSLSELVIARQQGAPPHTFIFTGPAKTREEIDSALASGLFTFSVDSCLEAIKVAEAAEARKVNVDLIVRINPDYSHIGPRLIMTGIPSAFGMCADAAKETFLQLRSFNHVRVAGFHIYTGTNIQKVTDLLPILISAIECIHSLARETGLVPKKVILGGGFGHNFAKKGSRIDFSSLCSPLTDALLRCFPGSNEQRPHILFESGRYLTASSGTLLCTVLDVKESKGKKFAIVDTGIHHIGGISGLNRLTPNAMDFSQDGNDTKAPYQQVHVVGPLCTPLDTLSKEVLFSDLKPGDQLLIPNVGAYGITASLMGFLSKPTPIEVVIDNDVVVSVSRVTIGRQWEGE